MEGAWQARGRAPVAPRAAGHGRRRFRGRRGPRRVQLGPQLEDVLLEPCVRPLQLARALLELRQAALRDEGDDEGDDRRQDEHRRQQEEEGLH